MRGNESVANHMYEVANCHPKFMSFCTQAAQQAKDVCVRIYILAHGYNLRSKMSMLDMRLYLLSVCLRERHDGVASMKHI